jgi:FAD/FMN-containing dehydrogenase
MKLIRKYQSLFNWIEAHGRLSRYEPDWQRVFWGDKYERLVSIKRRVDPTHLFVCNRCVGGDLVLRP